jgi:hypothetical protein
MHDEATAHYIDMIDQTTSRTRLVRFHGSAGRLICLVTLLFRLTSLALK